MSGASTLPARPRSSRAAGTLPLKTVLATCDNSLKSALKADPASEARKPNQEPREVFGQWVEVEPTPLANPFLVALAPDMAAELGLDPACATDPGFAQFFSGDVAAARAGGVPIAPWATPYAVSVFGQPIPSPDPFGGGNAYGDGRAVSLGEFVCPPPAELPSGNGGSSAADAAKTRRWELQLKGSGTTPFSRGGDGRAVLRSSVREFLVSEAMHAMGVPTTRALCLVASGTEYTRRMWYAESDTGGREHPPDTLVTERCAITCRAAPSFIRVGHLELWARRASRGVDGAAAELRALVEHALQREFAEGGESAPAVPGGLPFKQSLFAMASAFAARQAKLAVAWLRVGYVQGNMNSDNCLLSGRTMDFGPFGFIERYEPLWSPFTSDMERKFGFERQPLAAQVNLMTLIRCLVPLLEREDDFEGSMAKLQAVVSDEYPKLLAAEMHEMRRAKLGLAAFGAAAEEALWTPLSNLLAKSGIDYTLFWRQLAEVTTAEAAALVAAVAARGGGNGGGGGVNASVAGAADVQAAAAPMMAHLGPAFFNASMCNERKAEWTRWLAAYAQQLVADGRADAERKAEMHATSPKFIPREWILAEAYTKAEGGDFSVLHELMHVFATPFDEHTPELSAKYYRLPPSEVEKRAGIAFFS